MINIMAWARLYRDAWDCWGAVMVAAASGYSQPPKEWRRK